MKYQDRHSPDTVQFNLRLNRDLVQEFQLACIREGQSQTAVTTELLKSHVDRSNARYKERNHD